MKTAKFWFLSVLAIVVIVVIIVPLLLLFVAMGLVIFTAKWCFDYAIGQIKLIIAGVGLNEEQRLLLLALHQITPYADPPFGRIPDMDQDWQGHSCKCFACVGGIRFSTTNEETLQKAMSDIRKNRICTDQAIYFCERLQDACLKTEIKEWRIRFAC